MKPPTINSAREHESFIGKKYYFLTVIGIDYREQNGYPVLMFVCQCDCGNIKTLYAGHVKQGNTKSCGCMTRIENGIPNKKYNRYNLDGEYGIGYTSKGEEFYFDLDDYEKIKDVCWHLSRGYVIGRIISLKKDVFMHWIVLGITEEGDLEPDHINRDRKDNRKKNLRMCTHGDNNKNMSTPCTNLSGVTGVSFDNFGKSWRAVISGKKLGRFKNKEDAIIARLRAEKEIYKEFAPQRHLFKEYKII